MLKNLFSLSGRNALVTGSSQGIGRASALALAEFGANVLIHNHDGSPEASQVADEVQALGVQSGVVGVDLSEPDAPAMLFQLAKETFSHIDILVINASMQVAKEWQEMTPADFDNQVTTNWKSTLLLFQQFAPPMVERGWGRLVTIGSVQELKPHPAMMVYAGTKAAIANMVKNLAIQVADKGVTVNNLAPGVINTPRINEPTPPIDERISKRLDTPVGFLGEPMDCTGMALVLCSDAGRYVTGQDIFVDGGMSL